jgi:hypothetical protein
VQQQPRGAYFALFEAAAMPSAMLSFAFLVCKLSAKSGCKAGA